MPSSDQDDLKSLIFSLSKNVKNLQVMVEGNAQLAIQCQEKQLPASSLMSFGGAPKQTDECANNRPPRFQKMDFPKYDGKSDPLLAFINRCKSYFHQQHIVKEEKV